MTVTSAAHGRTNGETLEIIGTTYYNGRHVTITNVSTDTFQITATWVADDATGTWSTGAVSAGTYVYYEDEYDLAPDFLRPVDQRRFSSGVTPIWLVGRSEFRRSLPRNFVSGSPTTATIVERAPGAAASTGSITAFATRRGGSQVVVSATGHGRLNGDHVRISGTTNYDGAYFIHTASTADFYIDATFVANDATGTWTADTLPRRRIVFGPSPDKSQMIQYSYITDQLVTTATGITATSLVNDTDEPIVPIRYRHAILFHALYHWYRDKKDDIRSGEAKAEYTDLMLRVVADNEIGSNHAQVRPRVGSYRRRAKRPYGGPRGRFDINGKFDRFEI